MYKKLDKCTRQLNIKFGLIWLRSGIKFKLIFPILIVSLLYSGGKNMSKNQLTEKLTSEIKANVPSDFTPVTSNKPDFQTISIEGCMSSLNA